MISNAKKEMGIAIRIIIINKEKKIERDSFGIFFFILLKRGKEIYARRMLPKMIVITGLTSKNKRINARINRIKGTIFLY